MTIIFKPRILIIVDRPGWAHDHKTGNLQRTLNEKYHIIKKYQSEVTESDFYEVDLIQAYYWLQLQRLPHLESAFNKNLHKLLIGVCSHVELNRPEWRESALAWLGKAHAIFVVNQLIYQEVQSLLNIPIFYTPNGVDTNFFTPVASKYNSGKLRVGWSGSLNNHGSDYRGFDNLIVPATDAMEGVELVTAIRENHWRSHDEMGEFYRSLDVYICASYTEGTPNTALEAAACGIPVIATRVGNMPELIKPGVNGYFIERDVSDIIRVLTILRDDPEHRKKLGRAIHASILDWDWSLRAENYHQLYQFALGGSAAEKFKTLNEEHRLNELNRD